MGQGQTKKITLQQFFTYLIEDSLHYLTQEEQNILNQIQIISPLKSKKELDKLIAFIRKPVLSQLLYIENESQYNINSLFQYYLLIPLKEHQKYDGKIKLSFVRDFRLMCFSSLNFQQEGQYEIEMINLFAALNRYCIMVNKLISELKQNDELKWKLYSLFWNHYSHHLPRLGEIYDFSHINKAFEEQFMKISKNKFPPLRIEIFAGKIFGINVTQPNIEILINQIFIYRRHQQQVDNKELQQIIQTFFDLNIDEQNIKYQGFQELKFSSQVEYFKSQLINDTEQLLKEKKLDQIYEFWIKDNIILQNILPQWFIDNYISKKYFEIVDSKLEIIINNLSQEEKNEIFSYKQISNELEQFSNFNEQITFNDIKFSNFDDFLSNQYQNSLSRLANQIMSSQSTNAPGSNYISNEQGLQQQLKIGEQVDSDILQSEITKKNSGILIEKMALKQIEQFCKQYDKIKFKIESSIQYRNNQLGKQIYNNNYQFINQELLKFYDFTTIIYPEDVQKAISLLQSNVINHKQYFQQTQIDNECLASILLKQL